MSCYFYREISGGIRPWNKVATNHSSSEDQRVSCYTKCMAPDCWSAGSLDEVKRGLRWCVETASKPSKENRDLGVQMVFVPLASNSNCL